MMTCMICGTTIRRGGCPNCGNNKGTLMQGTDKNEIRIRVQCTQNVHHAKILRFRSDTDLTFIEALAALIDGTHPAYVNPPNPAGRKAPPSKQRCGFCNEFHEPGKHSPIGRCAICGATLETSIEMIDNPPRSPAPNVARALRASLEEDAEHREQVG